MQEAEKAGLEGFLIKPVNSSVFFDTIMQALGKDAVKISPAVRQREQEVELLQNIHGARVLLVEDNEINRQVAKEILTGAGLEVFLANDGQEAVDAVGREHYDAVLMDIQMPVMDGYTAAREIRNLKSKIRNVPIIAMTAHAMSGDREKTLAAGMNDHVTKPIDPNQLFSALGKWIRPVEDRKEPEQPEIPKPEVDVSEEYLPDSLPGFDLAAGLERLQGNKRLYRKLLLDFASKYSAINLEIREALMAENMDLAHSLVHNLKGLAGNLSATDLLQTSVEMEKLIRTGKETTTPYSLEQKLEALDNALTKAVESIRVLGLSAEDAVIEDIPETTASMPPELAKETAQRLRDAVDMGDVMKLSAIAEELKFQSDDFTPLSDKIIQLAEDFDFDGISQLADVLEKDVNN
jgi:two-component system sensor histidine kinase/response regulator